MRFLDYIIKEDDDGKDVKHIFTEVLMLSGYLIRRNKHIPGSVTLDGNPVTVRHAVHKGQRLSVLLSDVERSSSVIPHSGFLDIIYEDEDLIVLNKRPEDIVHPDHNHLTDTLGNYLLSYYDTKNDPSDFHPVQRLDHGTSGLLVIAKHSYAQDKLSRSLHTPEFSRTYLALCCGTFCNNSGTVDVPIARLDPSSIKRSVDISGLPARTDYRIIDCDHEISAVELKLHTGRTHQIRVHMSYLGNPLIGDELYGSALCFNMSRPALHSWKLSFLHPVTGAPLSFTAPAPDDMQSVIGMHNLKVWG